MFRISARAIAAAAIGGLTAAAPAQVVRSVTLVAITGEPVPGSDAPPVASLNPPFTSGNGTVGFTGTLQTDNPQAFEGFVFVGDRIAWRNSHAPPGTTLRTAEPSMGVGDAGQFIYCSQVLGETQGAWGGVWSHQGPIAMPGQACPDGSGRFWVSAFQPLMRPDGTMYFLGFTSAAPGGPATNRGLWRVSPDVTQFTRILTGNTVVDGFTLTSLSSDGTYWISDNGAHHIHVLTTTEASDRRFVYVDGRMRHRLGAPTGSPLGDLWMTHNAVSINNDGHYVIIGRTNAAQSVNDVLALDGRIKIREGDSIGGRAFPSPAGPLAVSINNRRQVAVLWSTVGSEVLLFGYGPLIRTRSVVLIEEGDTIDVNQDGAADYTVTGINTASPIEAAALDIATDHRVFVNTDLAPIAGGAEQIAIIGIEIPPSARCPADWNQSGTVEPQDVAAFVADWFTSAGTGDLNTDFDGDDAITPADVAALVAMWFAAATAGC